MDMPVYFAHRRSPWERPSNENPNGLVREHLPKGTEITATSPTSTPLRNRLTTAPTDPSDSAHPAKPSPT